MIELASENAPGRVKIGTTSRGIGPAYEDKMGRRGLRVVDLLDLKLLKTHIENAVREKNMIVHALFNSEPLDADKMYTRIRAGRRKNCSVRLRHGVAAEPGIGQGESVLFEGAQGTMLDIDHGTYPFVTSSSATSGGAVIGTGVPPNCHQYGYRHHQGLLHARRRRSIPDRGLKAMSATICESEATSTAPSPDVHGAPGWLDLPLLRYSGMINGTSWLVVTKLDVLDELAEIPVCVGLKIDGKQTDEIPAQSSGYDKIECVYEKFPGWKTSTEGITRLRQATETGPRIPGVYRQRNRREDWHDFHRPRSRTYDPLR